MAENVVALMQSETGRRLVREKCKEAGLNITVLELLIEAELKQVGKLRKRGLREEFDEIFGVLDGEEN